RIAIAWLIVGHPFAALAQSGRHRFDADAHVTSATWSQFDGADVGIGGRFAWHPVAPVGIESDFNWYPKNFPERTAFSRTRVEGLFGATIGPALGRVRPFAQARWGFVAVQEAPQAIACMLIFPPPLFCELAAGRTLTAFDLGGGVEMFAGSRIFARVEAGDRLLRYPGQVLDSRGMVRERAFVRHGFRFAAGAGVRF